MSCHDFQQKLALLVGDELEVNEAVAARRHIAQCPTCRETLQGLTDSRTVMRFVSETPTEISGESLWPRLRAQISPATLVPPRRGYPSWMPTATLAAACVALLIFVGSTPIIDGQSEPGSFVDSSFGANFDPATDVSEYRDFGNLPRTEFSMNPGFLAVNADPRSSLPQVYRRDNLDPIDEL